MVGINDPLECEILYGDIINKSSDFVKDKINTMLCRHKDHRGIEPHAL
jgi:hypothetical protein